MALHHKFFLIKTAIFFSAIWLLSGCNAYKQNILFKANGDLIYDQLLMAQMNVQQNYIIRPFDRLAFRVFSNQGQEIKWPDLGGSDNKSGTTSPSGNLNNNSLQAGSMINRPDQYTSFVVQTDGRVYLPMVGDLKLEGFTTYQADSLLSLKFEKYYEGAFVRTLILNKRVILLKGSEGQVVNLLNENTTLIELLAQSGGIPNDVRAKNVRLIRGDLQNPNVFVLDLSTIEGMRRVNLVLQPNDIVYLEPVRKTFVESLSDAAPVISILSSITTLALTFVLAFR